MLELEPVETLEEDMAKQPSFSLEDMTGKQLEELIQRAVALKQEKKGEAIQNLRAKITEMCDDEGITLAEVFPPLATQKRGRPKATGEPPTGRAPARMKYQDPANPENQWSGKGRPPRWMQPLLDDGHEKEEYLIDK